MKRDIAPPSEPPGVEEPAQQNGHRLNRDGTRRDVLGEAGNEAFKPEPGGETRRSVPVWLIGCLAMTLVVLGFAVGYGFHTVQATPQSAGKTVKPAVHPIVSLSAPIVKGLRLSPDGRLLAFTAVYNESTRANRFLLDLTTGKWATAQSPPGWQDYITQWNPDGKSVLFEREKIPQPFDKTTPGLYRQEILLSPAANAPSGKGVKTPAPATPATAPTVHAAKGGGNQAVVLKGADGAMPTPGIRREQLLTKGLAPPDETVSSGFWTPNGTLIIKTKSEPKALYEVRGGRAVLLDRAEDTYYQNRAVNENGRLAFYVVRDMGDPSEAVALYRLQDGKLRRLSPPLNDVVWVYLAENVRRMVVGRYAANGQDWVWSLYQVTPTGVRLEKAAPSPAMPSPSTGRPTSSICWAPAANRCGWWMCLRST